MPLPKRFLLAFCVTLVVLTTLVVLLPDVAIAAENVAGAEDSEWMQRVDEFFGNYCVKPLETVLFFDFWTKDYLKVSIPLIVFWMLLGSLFFTFRMGFINVRAFTHALRLTRGDYATPTLAYPQNGPSPSSLMCVLFT